MTNRRHDDGSGDEQLAFGSDDAWRDLGADRSSDDFWGDTPDWSGTASTTHRTGRGRIGAPHDDVVDPTPIGSPRTADARNTGVSGALRQAWDQLLGGGADVTRGHRRVEAGASPADPTPAAPHAGMFDDLDDDEWLLAAGEVTGPADDTPIRNVERQWTAEATAASAEQSQQRRPHIDPLLARLGAIVIVASLVVPLLVALVSSSDEIERAADAVVSETTEPIPTLLPSADAPAAPVMTEPLDPASLPPAVPVNTDASDAVAAPAAIDELVNDRPPAEESDATSADDSVTSSTSSSRSSTAVAEGDTDDASDASLEGVEQPAAAEEPADRVEPEPCAVDYTVVAGDFWIRLADAADVSLTDLLAVNRATTDTPLYPGREICLPAGATTPAPPTTAAPATTEVPTTTAAPTTAAPTTAAPTTTEATTTTVAEEPPGPEEIKQIIRDVFPDELEAKALDIAFRESRYVPTAKNFCCYGLFQIYWEVHDVWLVDLGITSASQLFDPETNARAAYALYQRAGGWGPWTTA